MAVGAVQLFDHSVGKLLDSSESPVWAWDNDAAATTQWQATLLDNTAVPLDSHDQWQDMSTNELANAGDYDTGGINVPLNANQQVTTYDGPSTGSAAKDTKFVSDAIEWTPAGNVTIAAAKWLIVSAGTAPAAGTDTVLFWVDLDDTTPGNGGTTVSSTSSTFRLSPHATDGWFYITGQA